MSLELLRKALKEEKLVYGERQTLKLIKLGKTQTVFLAKNCKPSIRETINEYSKHTELNIVELDVDATEIGTICKKEFPISVLSY
jgi:ribosomal protein L30E